MKFSSFEKFLNNAEILEAIAKEQLTIVYDKLFEYLPEGQDNSSRISIGKFTQLLIDSNLFQSFGDLTYIPFGMFTNTNISDITIPTQIQAIRASAFYACVNLSKIEIPLSVKSIDQGAFCNSGLTQIKLNEGLKEIYYDAFAVTKLEHITLPASIEILKYPFMYCKLKSIEFLGNSIQVLKLGAETNIDIAIPKDADELEQKLRKEGYNHIRRK